LAKSYFSTELKTTRKRLLKIICGISDVADCSGGAVGNGVLGYVAHGGAVAARRINFKRRNARQCGSVVPNFFTGAYRAELASAFLIVTTGHKLQCYEKSDFSCIKQACEVVERAAVGTFRVFREKAGPFRDLSKIQVPF
jgi:hypothetical protein